MLYDILKDTPAYQDLTKESRQEGLEEGRLEGLKEGRLEALERARQERLAELRRLAVDVVKARFPKLGRLTKKQLVLIEDSATLHEVIVKMSTLQTSQEVQEYLLSLDELEEEEQ